MVLYGAELKEPHTELLLSSLFCPTLALYCVAEALILGTQRSHVSHKEMWLQGSQWTCGILTQGSRTGPGSL